jgi:hypothetical protein
MFMRVFLVLFGVSGIGFQVSGHKRDACATGQKQKRQTVGAQVWRELRLSSFYDGLWQCN